MKKREEIILSIRYSDLTVEQLREELGKLKELSQKAEQLGEVNKVAIYERKLQMVSSYMLNPDDFNSKDVYELKGDPGYTFIIEYIDGVMAWGYRINLLGEQLEKIEALPIALLGEKIKEW